MPCLQFQMFEKTCERSGDNNQQQSFKRFPQCTPRSSAGNQNGERVGGKWTVCYFLRNAQAPHVSATHFWNKSDLKRSGIARVTHIQIFLLYESFVEAEGTEWGIVVIMFSSCGGVWVRRSAGLRLCMWVIHANNQIWPLAVLCERLSSVQRYLNVAPFSSRVANIGHVLSDSEQRESRTDGQWQKGNRKRKSAFYSTARWIVL